MSSRGSDGFRLTVRDGDVLLETFFSNCLTSRQAVGLGLFSGRSRANRRLKTLADKGYLRRRPIPLGQSSAETAYFLGLGAVPVVTGLSGMDPKEIRRHACRPLGRTFIEHSILVTGCRIHLMGLATPRGAGWRSEAECRHEYSAVGRDGIRRSHVLKPDGALVVGGCEPFVAFLEADRNMVSPMHWERTVRGYSRYSRLGLCAEAYGTARFAVLVVTEGGEGRVRRLASIAGLVDAAFFFATVAALKDDPRCWTAGTGDARWDLDEILSHGRGGR